MISRRESLDDSFYKKLLDDLLGEIGLETADGKVVDSFIELNRHGKFIRDTASGGVCRVVSSQGISTYLVCSSYKKLAKCLKTIRAFKFLACGQSILERPSKSKANPWFSCSVDEMLVHRDLLASSSKAEGADEREP